LPMPALASLQARQELSTLLTEQFNLSVKLSLILSKDLKGCKSLILLFPPDHLIFEIYVVVETSQNIHPQ